MRELRVAARDPRLFRVRLNLSVLFFLLFAVVASGQFIGLVSNAGGFLYYALGSIVLLIALFAGVVLSADTINEERREGTLVLLCLSPLSRFGIVLGKLASSTCRALQFIFCAFPIFAFAILFGGVTVGEVARLSFLLIVTLFLSTSLGLAVSAWIDSARLAQLLLFLGLSIFCFALPLVGLWLTSFTWAYADPIFIMLSPPAAFFASSDLIVSTRPELIRMAFAVFLLISVIGIVVAAHGLSRREVILHRTKDFTKTKRAVISGAPALWFARRSLHGARSLKLFLFSLGSIILGSSFLSITAPYKGWLVWFGWVAAQFALLLWVAYNAGHKLAADRSSRFHEVLLTTPISLCDILQGQQNALAAETRQTFWGVVAIGVLGAAFGFGIGFWPLILVSLSLAFHLSTILPVGLSAGLISRSPARTVFQILWEVVFRPLAFFLLLLFIFDVQENSQNELLLAGVSLGFLNCLCAWVKAAKILERLVPNFPLIRSAT